MQSLIDSTPVIWMSGLPEAYELQARNAVAKKYGFHFERRFGCVVPKAMRNPMLIHNQQIESMVAKKLGQNWKDGFYEEVDIMRGILKQLDEFTQQNKILAAKNSTLPGGEAIYYELLPGSYRNHILISACVTKELDWKLYKYEYYKALVDGAGNIWFDH